MLKQNLELSFFLAVSFSALVLVPANPSHGVEPDRPNILFVLTDDQGWPTLGCYGGDKVPTPNLDRLAAEGMKFTDAYVTSQCTPTRATFLTGQYTARHGLWHVLTWYGYPWARMTEPMFAENFPRDTFTIAKGMKTAGYTTGIMGKWHVTSDEFGNYRGLTPEGAPIFGFDHAPPRLPDDEFDEGADRGVETLTRQAIDFIRDNREKPWFCFLSHHMIHGKVVAPDHLVQKYLDLGYPEEGHNRAVYLAGLETIDQSMGMLMSALEETGEADNTMVVFLSDNGGIDERYGFGQIGRPNPERPKFEPDGASYDNAPLRLGKGSCYEGGVRVPMIVRWPARVPAGQTTDVPVHVIDLLPTFLELASAESPKGHTVDGESLVALLEDGEDPSLADRPIFQYYPFYDLRWGLTPSATVRQGDLKLIEFFGDRVDGQGRYVPGHRLELYDLAEDLSESINLAESRPEDVKRLHDTLHGWMGEVGAEVPKRNPHHDPSRAFVETREKPPWIEGQTFETKRP